jgi:hypothetical protein
MVSLKHHRRPDCGGFHEMQGKRLQKNCNLYEEAIVEIIISAQGPC